MSTITSTCRFPGPLDNDLLGLISSLIPIQKCHFLATSYTPLGSFDRSYPENMIRKLLNPENIMVLFKMI